MNTLGETADISPGNGICMDSGGLCTLKAAVMETNALAGADTINLIAGTYSLSGTLAVTGDLTINGVGAGATILDGPGTLGVRGFDVNPAVDLALNDLTMRDYMAAIHVYGNQLNGGTITLQDSILRDNHSSDTSNSGSAILLYCQGCTVTLRNTDVYNNSARTCGAISSRGHLLIERDSVVRDNQATYSAGGAICNNGGAQAINNSSIYSNLAAGDGLNLGGAIYQTDGSTAISLGNLFNNTSSDIISNTASVDGAGLLVSSKTTTIMNSTISGNKADRNGAGLHAVNTGTAKLGNVTVANNTADADDNGDGRGGGIYRDDGTVLLRNSVVAKNLDLTKSTLETWAPDCFGAITSDGYNFFGMVNFLCTVSGDMSGVLMGASAPGLDAKLLPLTNDYSATFYHPPLLGPVVDRGNPAGCPAFNGAVLMQDQVGEARIFGIGQANYYPRCDLGAVDLSLKANTAFLPLVRK